MLSSLLEAAYNAINGTSAITNVVSTRIFTGRIPDGTAFPLVFIGYQSGGDENITPGQSLAVTLLVKCITDEDNSGAVSLADAIRTALHNTDLGTVSNWRYFDCQHETPIYYTEPDDRRTYIHAGGLYRLRAEENN